MLSNQVYSVAHFTDVFYSKSFYFLNWTNKQTIKSGNIHGEKAQKASFEIPCFFKSTLSPLSAVGRERERKDKLFPVVILRSSGFRAGGEKVDLFVACFDWPQRGWQWEDIESCGEVGGYDLFKSVRCEKCASLFVPFSSLEINREKKLPSE